VKIDTAPDDDWETDADFVNNVSEKEQRWGSKAVEGSGKPAEALDLTKLRQDVSTSHEQKVKTEYTSKPGFSYGYGGKFGVQTDRMDKSAVGYDQMTEPKASHQSIPRYEKPKLDGQGKAIKSKFEQLANNPSAEQSAKIEAERKARQEREKQERERVRAEIEAKKAREAESAPAPAPAPVPPVKIVPAPAPVPVPVAEPEILEEPSAYQEYAAVNTQEYQAEPQDIQEPPVPAHEEIARTAELFTATALYEFNEGGEDELIFNEGDIITDIEVIDEGWWRGACNGRYGLFPANYVQAQ